MFLRLHLQSRTTSSTTYSYLSTSRGSGSVRLAVLAPSPCWKDLLHTEMVYLSGKPLLTVLLANIYLESHYQRRSLQKTLSNIACMSDKSVVAPPWCVTTDLWCEDISCRCSEDNWYSPRWRWFKTDRRCKIPGWAAPCSWHNRTDWHTVTLTARAALWWWGALSPHPNRGFPPCTHHACTNLSYLQKQSRSKEYLHKLSSHSTFSQLLPNSSAKQPVSCLSIIVNFILMHVEVPLKKLIHGE